MEVLDNFKLQLQEVDLEWEEDSSNSKIHSKLDSLEVIWEVEHLWEAQWEEPQWVDLWVEECLWEVECPNKTHLEEHLNKIHSKQICQWVVAWAVVWVVDLDNNSSSSSNSRLVLPHLRTQVADQHRLICSIDN